MSAQHIFAAESALAFVKTMAGQPEWEAIGGDDRQIGRGGGGRKGSQGGQGQGKGRGGGGQSPRPQGKGKGQGAEQAQQHQGKGQLQQKGWWQGCAKGWHPEQGWWQVDWQEVSWAGEEQQGWRPQEEWQGQWGGQGKGEGWQEGGRSPGEGWQSKGKGVGGKLPGGDAGPEEDAGGKGGKSKGQGKGGRSPVEEAGGGQAFLTAKGKSKRQTYLQALWSEPQTEAMRKKQEGVMRYMAEDRHDEPEVIPHQLKLDWPTGYKDLGHEFMKKWKDDAKQLGLSMRLGNHRNSTYRRQPHLAVATYPLTITAQDRQNPPKDLMVQFLCDWAKAAAQRTLPVAESALPWEDIIQWWDGEEFFCNLHKIR